MEFRLKRFEELTVQQLKWVEGHYKECMENKSMMCSDLHKDVQDFYYAHAEMDFLSFALIEDTTKCGKMIDNRQSHAKYCKKHAIKKEETKITGQLEIDTNRGVIWFNSNEGICRLRICRLTDTQINDLLSGMLDITMSRDWKKCPHILPVIPAGYSCEAPEMHKCTIKDCPCWSTWRAFVKQYGFDKKLQ